MFPTFQEKTHKRREPVTTLNGVGVIFRLRLYPERMFFIKNDEKYDTKPLRHDH